MYSEFFLNSIHTPKLTRTSKGFAEIVLIVLCCLDNPILIQDVLTYVSKELCLSDRLVAIRVPPCSFMEIDHHFIKSSIKIGVLYVKEGQTHEDEMFSNQSHSRQFEKFLQVLGDKASQKSFTVLTFLYAVETPKTPEMRKRECVCIEYKMNDLIF